MMCTCNILFKATSCSPVPCLELFTRETMLELELCGNLFMCLWCVIVFYREHLLFKVNSVSIYCEKDQEVGYCFVKTKGAEGLEWKPSINLNWEK